MSIRVLLADDSPTILKSVRALLDREGFDVVGEANDGQKALDLARSLNPDVAILDLAMPQLGGLEAAREIVKACPGTRVMLLTQHRSEHQVIAAVRAGVRGYVVKADAAEDLVRAIGDVCRGRIVLSPCACWAVMKTYES